MGAAGIGIEDIFSSSDFNALSSFVYVTGTSIFLPSVFNFKTFILFFIKLFSLEVFFIINKIDL